MFQNIRRTPKLLPFVHRHNLRRIWIPPVWLRPLIRPLLIIIGGFIGGVILQLWRGQPPQWFVLKYYHYPMYCIHLYIIYMYNIYTGY